MESDLLPKIDLVVDDKPVGQLGLAKFQESMLFDENTDYSDSDSDDEAGTISEGGQVQAETNAAPAKRSSARIRLSNQAGTLHKRTRLA